MYIGPLRINASDMMQSYEDNLLKDKPKGLEPLVVCVLCLCVCVCVCVCIARVGDRICVQVCVLIYMSMYV